MDYNKTDYYSIREWVYPDIEKILDTSFNLSENIILYLPRNIEIQELISLIFQLLFPMFYNVPFFVFFHYPF